MKIETRFVRPPMNDGSSTSWISTTLPSAGAITTRSPRGPARSGSRKKYATQTVRTRNTKASSQSGHERRFSARANVASAMTAAIAMKMSPSRAKLTVGGSAVRRSERRAGQAREHVEVARARGVDHVLGQRRGRCLAVPSPRTTLGVEVIAQRLLVEARLWSAGRVARGIPEA